MSGIAKGNYNSGEHITQVLTADGNTAEVRMNGYRGSCQIVTSGVTGGTWTVQVTNDGTNWESTSLTGSGSDIGVIEGPFRGARVTASGFSSYGSITAEWII